MNRETKRLGLHAIQKVLSVIVIAAAFLLVRLVIFPLFGIVV